MAHPLSWNSYLRALQIFVSVPLLPATPRASASCPIFLVATRNPTRSIDGSTVAPPAAPSLAALARTSK